MPRLRTTTDPADRRGRVWLTGALVGALAGGLLATAVVVAGPAQAVPYPCQDNATLTVDHTTYDLQGTCGVVRVEADHVVVNLPATQKLVVLGEGNVINGKTVDRLVLRGRDHQVRAASVRAGRVSSPGTVVDVEGLVEELLVTRRGADVRAQQVTDAVVRGRGHELTARRGYDARVPGDRSRLSYRRLDSLVLGGDRNRVVVRRHATTVRDAGSGNVVRVNRRR